MRYISNLILLACGMLLLFLGVTNSNLPQFVLPYMMLGGAVTILLGLVMFYVTVKDDL